MNLSGQLADWTMDDLLQIVHVTKKTGSLDIVGARKGRVHFREGKITGAELHSSRGVYAGTDPAVLADIVFVLGSLEEGGFAMGPADGPDVPGIEIEDVSEKVGELRELENAVAEEGLIGEGAVTLKPSIEEEVTITPDDWSAIASLVQPFTFSSLEERLGRGAAIRMVHAFHRLGIAEVAETSDAPSEVVDHGGGDVSEEESNWLDRLADEVSSTDSTKWLDEAVAEAVAAAEEAPAPKPAPTPEPEVVAASEQEPVDEIESDPEPEADPELDPEETNKKLGARGIAAPASTTLTTGVYDDIRRLRSKVSD